MWELDQEMEVLLVPKRRGRGARRRHCVSATQGFGKEGLRRSEIELFGAASSALLLGRQHQRVRQAANEKRWVKAYRARQFHPAFMHKRGKLQWRTLARLDGSGWRAPP